MSTVKKASEAPLSIEPAHLLGLDAQGALQKSLLMDIGLALQSSVFSVKEVQTTAEITTSGVFRILDIANEPSVIPDKTWSTWFAILAIMVGGNVFELMISYSDWIAFRMASKTSSPNWKVIQGK